MGKVTAIINLLRRGYAVSDPGKWRKGTIQVNAVVLLLGAAVATAQAFGLDLNISEAQLAALAGGLLAVANIVLGAVSDTDSSVADVVPRRRKASDEHGGSGLGT